MPRKHSKKVRNAGQGGRRFFDDFTRANGAIGGEWTGATWTIASNRALNTPVSAVTDLVTNGAMAEDSGWTKGTGWTIGAGVAVHASGQAASNITQDILTAGKWYKATWKITRASTGNYQALLGSTNGGPGATSIATRTFTGKASNATFGVRAVATNSDGDIDDLTCAEFTLAELFAYKSAPKPNGILRVKLAAFTAGANVGAAIRLDSNTAPTTGIVVYYTGTSTLNVDQFTGTTTWTNLITGTKAFTAADELLLYAYGASLTLYHRTAAGVTTTIGTPSTSATVLNGGYMGIFSTAASNTIEEVEY